jgi:hypothetical protein
MIELQALVFALAGHVGEHMDQQFVELAWCQVHMRLP